MRAMHLLKALLVSGLLAASSLLCGEAAAQKRVALVIGNSNYINVRALANPENDASAMAALFRNAKFDVVEANNNLGGLEMRRLFRDFAEKSRGADIAVVYYAGHGIEIDGTNYLLPIDTALKRDIDVEDEAISLDRIVRMLEPAKRLRLIILDACRDNPFVKTVRRTSETRSIGRGLVRIEPSSSDTLIAYAAKERTTASDGDGKHSPFTTALLKNLTVPGLDLRIALGRVRDDVMEMTRNRQEPFVYGSLGGANVALVSTQAGDGVEARPDIVGAQAARDYELAAKVGSKEAWDVFLAKYPTGFYSDLARVQRARLIAALPIAPSTQAAVPQAVRNDSNGEGRKKEPPVRKKMKAAGTGCVERCAAGIVGNTKSLQGLGYSVHTTWARARSQCSSRAFRIQNGWVRSCAE
jgi:hypothetical protein